MIESAGDSQFRSVRRAYQTSSKKQRRSCNINAPVVTTIFIEVFPQVRYRNRTAEKWLNLEVSIQYTQTPPSIREFVLYQQQLGIHRTCLPSFTALGYLMSYLSVATYCVRVQFIFISYLACRATDWSQPNSCNYINMITLIVSSSQGRAQSFAFYMHR